VKSKRVKRSNYHGGSEKGIGQKVMDVMRGKGISGKKIGADGRLVPGDARWTHSPVLGDALRLGRALSKNYKTETFHLGSDQDAIKILPKVVKFVNKKDSEIDSKIRGILNNMYPNRSASLMTSSTIETIKSILIDILRPLVVNKRDSMMQNFLTS
tara:strand:- start:927 stop:1394 length:468 start_codon:yes stop_codon:yes gene_type:complete